MSILNVTSSGTVDKGLVYPIRGSRVFIRRAENIRKTRLSPIDKTSFFRKPISLNLSMYNINSPGIMVKQRNPKTCLKKGRSINIERSAARTIAARARNQCFALSLFNPPATEDSSSLGSRFE